MYLKKVPEKKYLLNLDDFIDFHQISRIWNADFFDTPHVSDHMGGKRLLFPPQNPGFGKRSAYRGGKFPPRMVRNMRGVEKMRVSYSVTLVSTGMSASVKLCQHGGFVTNNYELIRNDTTRSPESVGNCSKWSIFSNYVKMGIFFNFRTILEPLSVGFSGFATFWNIVSHLIYGSICRKYMKTINGTLMCLWVKGIFIIFLPFFF